MYLLIVVPVCLCLIVRVGCRALVICSLFAWFIVRLVVFCVLALWVCGCLAVCAFGGIFPIVSGALEATLLHLQVVG